MKKERIEELREAIRTGRLLVSGPYQDIADLLALLDEKTGLEKPAPPPDDDPGDIAFHDDIDMAYCDETK